jgi:hypothetical protein
MPNKAQFANTQDLVTIETIRDNAVLQKDGSLRQVVMVSGVNTALKSEMEMDLISSTYQSFLNALDFPIQIMVHSRKINITRYLDGLETRKREEPSALLQSQIAEYKEFIAGFVRDNEIMEKIFFVVVPFSPIAIPTASQISGLSRFLPFLNKNSDSEAAKKETSDQEKEVKFQESLNQLIQRTSQVIEGLRAVELDAVVLNNQELIELFYNFYNPEKIEKETLNLPT